MSVPVRILQGIDGARQASGATVVLDVFRAFTTACVAFSRGAAELLAVDSLDLARTLHRDRPGSLLVGEQDGRPPSDFHHDNSPSAMETAPVAGQTLIHSTSAGTRCLIAASPQADLLLAAAFVNAEATVQYLLQSRPHMISIVCSGNGGKTPAAEDTACAQWLAARLQGQHPDFAPVLAQLRSSLEAQRFLNPEKRISPARDFDLCTQLDRYSFALVAAPVNDHTCQLQPVQTAPPLPGPSTP